MALALQQENFSSRRLRRIKKGAFPAALSWSGQRAWTQPNVSLQNESRALELPVNGHLDLLFSTSGTFKMMSLFCSQWTNTPIFNKSMSVENYMFHPDSQQTGPPGKMVWNSIFVFLFYLWALSLLFPPTVCFFFFCPAQLLRNKLKINTKKE